MTNALMWFRDDLRIKDNAALEWLQDKGDIEAVYVLDTSARTRPLGRASKWWLHHSLTSLAKDLAAYDIPLHVTAGEPTTIIPQLVADLGVTTVAWSRRYYGPWCEQDAEIKARLGHGGIGVKSFAGHLLLEPWEVHTNTGGGYKVYTPFSRCALEILADEPPLGAEAPPKITGAGANLERTAKQLAGLKLLPEDRGEPAWAKDFPFTPGEAGAWQLKDEFLPVENYSGGRDFPAKPATSRLAAHLRFGEISVARLFHAVDNSEDSLVYRKELLWRDFAWHRLFENPHMVTECLREKFQTFPWWYSDFQPDDIYQNKVPQDSQLHDFAVWARGETGIPLVDAGMRELNATGTMHNRVRMVVGSLLTKNLRTHWRMGEQWFWDTLVDADIASNAFNWQWVAGCGDDAAPYFRIFNPETQQKRFDPDATYCARWIKELGTPFYPEPIVDLKLSRKAALEAYQQVK